jgi:hypothetical protein
MQKVLGLAGDGEGLCRLEFVSGKALRGVDVSFRSGRVAVRKGR